MVVVITSTGGVSKRDLHLRRARRPAASRTGRAQYLSEQVAGAPARDAARCGSGFDDPGLAARERAFLQVLRPAFTDGDRREEQRVFVGGAATLLGEARGDELEACQRLLEVLEQRAALLELARRRAREPRRPFVRVGRELEIRRSATSRSSARPTASSNRTLGAVSLLGPRAHGLRDRDPLGPLRRATSSRASSEEVYADN